MIWLTALRIHNVQGSNSYAFDMVGDGYEKVSSYELKLLLYIPYSDVLVTIFTLLSLNPTYCTYSIGCPY
jgi:hypothetical protein